MAATRSAPLVSCSVADGVAEVRLDRPEKLNALTLQTRVNGKLTQSGTTADMVNDIASLIEYLSGFMTLQAGDVILTGTPEGVVNVDVGDEVVTEIEGIGRLVNTIVGDDAFGR